MSKHVFILRHIHELSPEQEDVKLIGVYSTDTQASAALERAKKLPGFVDTPQGFEIARVELDKDHWTDGYVTVD